MHRVFVFLVAATGLVFATMVAPAQSPDIGAGQFVAKMALDHDGDDGGGNDGGGGNGPGLGSPEAWAWTQLTDEGTQVRYVTPQSTCPRVLFTNAGGQTVSRSMTQVSTVGQFPTTATVCTRLVSLGVTAARIDTTTTGSVVVRPTADGTVPLPRWTPAQRPATITVIGDTGCRVISATDHQNCATQWPLQPLATSAATSPVAPDLVIHVGDYIYRSDTQVYPTSTCGGARISMSDHTWGCLVTDFFRPSSSLLAQAPLVFVRGNHETCGRSGEVWFRYQANSLRGNGSCSDYTDPVRISAGTLGLLLFDSSCSGDDSNTCSQTQPQQLTQYTRQFNNVNTLARPGDFLLSHVPIWMVNGMTPTLGNPEWIDKDLEAATAATAQGSLSSNISLVLSGHAHMYQRLDFGNNTPMGMYRPAQLTVGSSGTELDNQTWQDSALLGKPVDGVAIGHLVTHDRFGYAVLGDTGTSWVHGFYNPAGTRIGGMCVLTRNTTGAEFPCGP